MCDRSYPNGANRLSTELQKLSSSPMFEPLICKRKMKKSSTQTNDEISFFIWPDNYINTSYPGFFNLMAISYADSNDLILAYNKKSIDQDWFSYALNICHLNASKNFIWIDNLLHSDSNSTMANNHSYSISTNRGFNIKNGSGNSSEADSSSQILLFMNDIVSNKQLLNFLDDNLLTRGIKIGSNNISGYSQISLKINNFNQSTRVKDSIDKLYQTLLKAQRIDDKIPVSVELYSTDVSLPVQFNNKASMYPFIDCDNDYTIYQSMFDRYNVWNSMNGMNGMNGMNDKSSRKPSSSSSFAKIGIPNGYCTTSKKGVLRGFDLLALKLGHTNMVIKDAFGAGGSDIYFFNNKQDIIDNFKWEDDYELFIIEEDLNFIHHMHIDNHSNDNNKKMKKFSNIKNIKVEWYATSYYDNEVIGSAYETINSGTHWKGSQKCIDISLNNKLTNITDRLLYYLCANDTGGFDFAVIKDRNSNAILQINLVDLNVTRFTGTCMTLLIADKYNIHDKFFLRKNIRIPQNITFNDILKYPGSKDLLFNKKSKNGVFPHVFYPKYNTCLLSVFGKNKQETYEKYNKFVNLFGLKQSRL